MADWAMSMSQGGRLARTLTYTNDDGTAVDTTGWVWRCRLVGRGVDLPVPIVQQSLGVVLITIDKAASAALPVGVYALHVDWDDAAGNPPERELAASLTVNAQGAG